MAKMLVEPRIELCINNHNARSSIYRPGDTIHGKVIVYASADDDRWPIVVRFRGMATVSIEGLYMHDETICNIKRLLPKTYARNPEGHITETPFSITIPEKTNLSGYAFPSQLSWTTESHGLPPSMFVDEWDWFWGRVTYDLMAEIQEGGRDKVDPVVVSINIRGTAGTTSKPFELVYNKLTRPLRALTMGSSLIEGAQLAKQKLFCSQDIKLIARIPSKFDLGHTIPIWLRFEARTAPLASMPEV
jgi:hypothetical protein